jgi:hypothetical protein
MNAASVSAGEGRLMGARCTTILGGTSAIVETGSPGASNNTPSSSFDRGQANFLILIGVHRIRTIKSRSPEGIDRPKQGRPIGFGATL